MYATIEGFMILMISIIMQIGSTILKFISFFSYDISAEISLCSTQVRWRSLLLDKNSKLCPDWSLLLCLLCCQYAQHLSDYVSKSCLFPCFHHLSLSLNKSLSLSLKHMLGERNKTWKQSPNWNMS